MNARELTRRTTSTTSTTMRRRRAMRRRASRRRLEDRHSSEVRRRRRRGRRRQFCWVGFGKRSGLPEGFIHKGRKKKEKRGWRGQIRVRVSERLGVRSGWQKPAMASTYGVSRLSRTLCICHYFYVTSQTSGCSYPQVAVGAVRASRRSLAKAHSPPAARHSTQTRD